MDFSMLSQKSVKQNFFLPTDSKKVTHCLIKPRWYLQSETPLNFKVTQSAFFPALKTVCVGTLVHMIYLLRKRVEVESERRCSLPIWKQKLQISYSLILKQWYKIKEVIDRLTTNIYLCTKFWNWYTVFIQIPILTLPWLESKQVGWVQRCLYVCGWSCVWLVSRRAAQCQSHLHWFRRFTWLMLSSTEL